MDVVSIIIIGSLSYSQSDSYGTVVALDLTLIIVVKLSFLVLLNGNFVSRDPAVLRVSLQFLLTLKKFHR